MKPVHYVILDPTGNLTALVTSWGGKEDEEEITARLMRESEQVAYLEPPAEPGALAYVRLMGGEFCGNAAMAAAGWLIRNRLQAGQEMTVPIEVSGAQGVLFCRIRGVENGFEGTVEMPRVLEIRPVEIDGIRLTEVRTEGITHLIREEKETLEKDKAEALLLGFAEKTGVQAAGLMDRNPETGFMKPLVYVRASHTLVWETACGSGTAAVGAMEAWRRGSGAVTTAVPQPGGILRAEAVAEQGTVSEIRITGTVRIGKEKVIA
jgi:diaminopimelate epimerase